MAGDDAIEFFFLLVLIGLEEKVLQNIHLLSKDCWNKITKKFTIENTAIKTTTKNKAIDILCSLNLSTLISMTMKVCIIKG